MLKKLKSLFIIEDGQATAKKVESQKPANSTSSSKRESNKNSAPIAKSSATPPTPSAAGPGKVTTKFLNVLLSAMDENNLDGFDYLEYKESLKSLNKMDMDEATRYQSAFAMASTMGATPAQLTKTAQHYIDILAQEENKFKQALVNQRNKQIHDKEDQLNRLKLSIENHQKQIEKLTQEIAKNKEKMDALSGSLAAAAAKLDNTQNNFLVTYDKLVEQIKLDIEKMNQYLK